MRKTRVGSKITNYDRCTYVKFCTKRLSAGGGINIRRWRDHRPDGRLTIAKDAKSLLKRENGNVDWVVCRIAAQRQKYPMHRPRKVRHTMLSKLERGRTKVVQRPSRFIACVATAATFLRISSYFQTFFLLSVPSPYFHNAWNISLSRVSRHHPVTTIEISVFI